MKKLSIETLEVRIQPATVVFNAGLLEVSNQVGSLTLSTTPVSGQINVQDGVTNSVFSGVTGICVTGTNSSDFIALVLGSDAPWLTPQPKAFVGDIVVNGGNGNDRLTLSNGHVYSQGVLNGNLTFTGEVGCDTFMAGAGLNAVHGTASLSLERLDMLNTGFPEFGAMKMNIIGESKLSMTIDGFHFFAQEELYIKGTSHDDKIEANSGVAFYSRGTTNIDLGGGKDQLILMPNSLLSNEASGPATIDMGEGDDKVTLGRIFFPNLVVILGGGNNCFRDLGDYYGSGGYTIYGHLSIISGNQSDSIIVSGLASSSLSIYNGNGCDYTVITVADNTTHFYYDAGNGKDSLTFDSGLLYTQSFSVDLVFGLGNQTLSLDAAFILFGTVTGWAGESYVYNENGADVSNLVFSYFP